MKCPACGSVDLVMSERQGIEIDYCPQCRGVWLDRGELDKIIERTQREFDAEAAPASGLRRGPDDSDIYPAQGHGQPHYKKRKHWLLELLD